MKIKVPEPGFKNILLKVTLWLFPAVTLFPSGGDWAIILIPGFVLDIVKVPNTKPVLISWDWIIAWFDEIIDVTIKLVLKLILPPLELITAEPTTSPTLIVDIAKEPLSEANNEVDISGSFGSWLTLIVKSVKLSQSVLESDTETVGEKGIQEILPVLPPTQLPQLSVHAEPFTSPLQSTLKQIIVNGKVWTSASPNSVIILDAKVKLVRAGLTKRLFKIIVWLLPDVTLLLSGGEVATTSIPPVVGFSIVKVPYICPLLLSIAFTEIFIGEIIKSTSKVVFILIYPPPAVISLLPIISFVFSPFKLKYPESEEKTADEISGSLGSWLVANVIDAVSLHT